MSIFAESLEAVFVLVLLCSGVPLVCCCAAGLLTAMLQTVTQIQEQSLVFLVKFLTLAAVAACAGRILAAECLSFLQQQISAIALIGSL